MLPLLLIPRSRYYYIMEPDKAQIQQLFARYLAGQCSPEEEKLLWLWIWQLDAYDKQLFSSPEQEARVKDRMHAAILHRTGQDQAPYKKNDPGRRTADLNAIDQNSEDLHSRNLHAVGRRAPAIPAIDPLTSGAPAITTRIRSMRTLGMTAAILLLLVIPAVFEWIPQKEQARHPLVSFTNDGRHIKTLLLPDSSRVTLNLYSSLEWREANGQRQVRLKGEAYFEVHKDPLRPFIVLTDGLQTTALGTAFNIESYGKEKEIRVSLVEGKIQVGERTDSIGSAGAGHSRRTPILASGRPILAPGQMVRYDRQSRRQQVQKIAVDDIAAWRNGALVFNNIPLAEALARLAQRYGLHIRYNPRLLKEKRVTAVFYRATWQGALSNILFLQDMQYQVKDSLVTVY